MQEQLELIHDWLLGKLVVLGGKQCIFPHGAEHIRKMIKDMK